jgi:hypothetical protein
MIPQAVLFGVLCRVKQSIGRSSLAWILVRGKWLPRVLASANHLLLEPLLVLLQLEQLMCDLLPGHTDYHIIGFIVQQ